MPGRLVLCPTPLGNLEDVTLRVLRCLRECDVVFAEDTRVSVTLLRHYEIDKPMRSFHEGVEVQRLRELARLLADGKLVAVVTDAGMPGISDPGVDLVRAARESGAAVEVLPGPSALLGALVLSAFDVSRFRFDGFPPRKPGARRTYLESLRSERVVTVWYEAPTRVRDLLADVAAIFPERRVFALREYTKKFEEHLIGTASDVLAALADPPRGEFVVVFEGARELAQRRSETPKHVVDAMRSLIEGGVRPRLAVDALVAATGLPKNELYALAQSIGGRSLDGPDRN
jgi:16S rRNA (cytidine1402-2'-O)-methyltransferase